MAETTSKTAAKSSVKKPAGKAPVTSAKPTAKKPVAAKPAVANATPTAKKPTVGTPKPVVTKNTAAKPTLNAKNISGEQRYRMIAEAAYYRAERNQFKSDPLRDWIEAEGDIAVLLGGSE